jgi:GNAT superfamily N-acetyltransferase
MEIRRATVDDIPAYVDLGRTAQSWLKSRGLAQYVPAAHEENGADILAQVAAGVLYVVWLAEARVAFFSLNPKPSRWWPADEAPALYLAGMVVSRSARGLGIGAEVVRWSRNEAARQGRQFLRLDCHAGNAWLRQYYERHGFTIQGVIEQQPGYEGCLYQNAATATAAATD